MSGDFTFGGEIAWRPTRDYIENSRLRDFILRHKLDDYDHLLRRSTADLEWFWSAVLADLGIEFFEPPSRIVDTSNGIAWTRWCVDGRLNIVHNCLDKWIGTPVESRAALQWEGEEGTTRTLSYRELWLDVNRCANALRALGVDKGDRVALFMPMCPELIVAFFATIKLGAIILPLFSGYGADAVSTRLRDAEASVLFTVDGCWRRGQQVHMKAVADEAAASSPSLRHMVVVSRLDFDVPLTSGRDHRWADALASQPASFGRRPADDHLHVRHDGPAEGSGAHALRLPDQGGAGHGSRLRRARRRDDVLDQ
jgi:acetyl-CoA synthetase